MAAPSRVPRDKASINHRIQRGLATSPVRDSASAGRRRCLAGGACPGPALEQTFRFIHRSPGGELHVIFPRYVGSVSPAEVSRAPAETPATTVLPPLVARNGSEDERKVEDASESPVLEIAGVSIYYGAFRAVRDASLTIRRQEITAL